MTCSTYQAAISEYVDGTLDGQARASVEAHVAICADCRSFLADMRAITAAARGLETLPPPPGAWNTIAQELSRTRPGLRLVQSRYTWLAAAALLMLVSASVVFVLRNRPVEESVGDRIGVTAGTAPGAASDIVESVQTELQLAEQHYDKAIAGLEQIAASEEESLDPQIASTLRKNLGVIDQAIAESRAALRTQPGSTPAQESLFEALRRKVGLLQDTIALMNEMRKGNQAGAAQIVEGLNKS